MYSGSNLRGNATTYIKEKKFHDRTWMGDSVGQPVGDTLVDPTDGYSFTSSHWNKYDFNDQTDAGFIQRSNILTNVVNGAGVRNRTGQKISVEWVKGSFTITTCALNTAEAWGTNLSEAYITPYSAGESTPHIHYIRSTIRIAIVKDLQYMSSDHSVGWDDVFESGGDDEYIGSVHSEQKIASMQRFKIMSDETVVLHAFNPITTIPFYIKGADIGDVYYDSPDVDAYTSCGLHVVWAAYVPNYWNIGGAISVDALTQPTIVGHTRMCFTDA